MNKTILKTLVIIVVCLAIGFLAGMEYKAYQVRSGLQEAADVFNEPSQQIISTPEKQEKQTEDGQEIQDEYVFIEKSIGDEIEFATIKVKVNGIKERQTLSGSFGTPAIAKENAKFVVIDLSITNIIDANFTFFPDNGFRLVDNKERQFVTYEDTIGSVENYLNVRELAPSIKESGVIVYEIPKDAISYSLLAGKGGTNEIYKVILK
jgi:hypothetical protein